MVLLNFDATQFEPTPRFEPLPAGRYVAAITNSALRPNRQGTGNFLELTFTILEGEYKGRQLWTRLNLQNPNEVAVKIAQNELAAICRAVGVLTPRDSIELHNLPLVINVGHRKRKDTGDIVNIIKGYEKRESAQLQPAATVPPWRR